jgi:hypothetical protein
MKLFGVTAAALLWLGLAGPDRAAAEGVWEGHKGESVASGAATTANATPTDGSQPTADFAPARQAASCFILCCGEMAGGKYDCCSDLLGGTCIILR